MAFLQRLRGEGIVKKEGEQKEEVVKKGPEGVSQLEVDIFETEAEVVIYAAVSGIDFNSLHVSVEGENDVVTIQGSKNRPVGLVHMKKEDGKYLYEECHWGSFYRQIILPEEVNPSQAEAKLQHGVLVLKLPIYRATRKEVSLKVENLEKSD